MASTQERPSGSPDSPREREPVPGNTGDDDGTGRRVTFLGGPLDGITWTIPMNIDRVEVNGQTAYVLLNGKLYSVVGTQVD